MIELGYDHMRERGEARLAPGNCLHRGRCLHNLLTGTATVLGADRADDAPLHGQDIEHLVAVLTQGAQGAATIGAIAVTRLRFDPLLGAWKMGRQGANRRWPFGPAC